MSICKTPGQDHLRERVVARNLIAARSRRRF